MVVPPFLSLLPMAGRRAGGGGWATDRGDQCQRPHELGMGLCPRRVTGSPSFSVCPGTAQSFLHPTKARQYDRDAMSHVSGPRRNGPRADGNGDEAEPRRQAQG